MSEFEHSTGNDLGEFLRSRRARLTPDAAGVVSYGKRRVPGLRREELAQLAGVSSTYYTRLEQGQSANASESVIDALAQALGLDDDERAHLHDLGRPARAKRPRLACPEVAQPSTVRLLEAMHDVPAVVVGRHSEVLAWNRLGHALLAGHHDFHAPGDADLRPNLTRMLFLDPHTRELYARWADEAALAVASLRLVAGRFRDDQRLAELVGELSVKSDEFTSLWSSHPVQKCTSGIKEFHHPEVGDFSLEFEVLHLPDDSGHRLIAYTPVDPAARAAVVLLGARAGQVRPVSAGER